MNIIKIERANDTQLRLLAQRFEWLADYRDIIQSQLPLLTVERAKLIGLLKTNHINEFGAV